MAEAIVRRQPGPNDDPRKISCELEGVREILSLARKKMKIFRRLGGRFSPCGWRKGDGSRFGEPRIRHGHHGPADRQAITFNVQPKAPAPSLLELAPSAGALNDVATAYGRARSAQSPALNSCVGKSPSASLRYL